MHQPTKPQHVTSLQQSFIATVYKYVDQSEKKRYESTSLVSGLQANDTQSDQTLFSQFCQAEFGMTLDIVTRPTKRMGLVQTGKIPPPLLIALRKVDQAQQLIAQAKQPTDSTVQYSV